MNMMRRPHQLYQEQPRAHGHGMQFTKGLQGRLAYPDNTTIECRTVAPTSGHLHRSIHEPTKKSTRDKPPRRANDRHTHKLRAHRERPSNHAPGRTPPHIHVHSLTPRPNYMALSAQLHELSLDRRSIGCDLAAGCRQTVQQNSKRIYHLTHTLDFSSSSILSYIES